MEVNLTDKLKGGKSVEVDFSDKQLKKLERAADINALQIIMAKYINKMACMKPEDVFDVFFAQKSDDVSIELEDSGMYKGPAQVKTFLAALAEYFEDPSDKTGWMELEHICNPLIVVNDMRTKARATWSIFCPESKWAMPNPCSQKELTALWNCGKYYVTFVRESGEWRIQTLQKIAFLRSAFQLGWMQQADCRKFPALVGVTPDEKPKFYTYCPDYRCASGGREWGPYVPETTDF